jgi:hypothetical protein
MSEQTLTSDPRDLCEGQTGIASCNDVLPFTQQVQQYNNVCMDPADRAQAMVSAANQALVNEGVPPNTLDATGANGNAGQFNFPNWNMQVDPTAFDDSRMVDPANAADAANTVYHESRHTQQWWDMATMRAGLGDTPDQLVSTMGIPQDVAEQAAQHPTLASDARENQAEQDYESVYGSGAAARNQTLSDTATNRAQYCSLPEEADAWRTGAEVSYNYPGGVDARNLQNCQ